MKSYGTAFGPLCKRALSHDAVSMPDVATPKSTNTGSTFAFVGFDTCNGIPTLGDVLIAETHTIPVHYSLLHRKLQLIITSCQVN